MTTAFLSVTGLRFLTWYEMGVTDPRDLVWLADFYLNQSNWNPNLAMASMMMARRYIEHKENGNRSMGRDS